MPIRTSSAAVLALARAPATAARHTNPLLTTHIARFTLTRSPRLIQLSDPIRRTLVSERMPDVGLSMPMLEVWASTSFPAGAQTVAMPGY